MTQIFVPSIYGDYEYGTIYYGGQWINIVPPPPGYPVPVQYPPQPPPGPPFQIPAGYSIQPVNSIQVDYETVMVTWAKPVLANNVLDFRLLRSRYGFPVDENDGAILLDTDSTGGVPQTQYFDDQIIPGQVHYYGIYLLIQLSSGQVWYRAGFTSLLANDPSFNSTNNVLMNWIPEYYTYDSQVPAELTTSDAFGNTYLSQFVSIFGWGEDYLRTQIALTAQVNNPQVIPIDWLANLAATIGFPYYSEITAGITRDAMSNAAALIQERGTLRGIEAMITQLTSWGADVRVGYNMMLEDDQSDFTDPVYTPWNSLISYDPGEYVTYQGYTFQSLAGNNLAHPPTNVAPLSIASGNSASGSSSYSYNITATAAQGTSVVVCATTNSSSVSVSSITDSKGNTYAAIASSATNVDPIYVFQCQSLTTALTTGIDTVTVHLSAATAAVDAIAISTPSVAVKDVVVSTAGTGTSATLSSGTLAQQGEQALAFLHVASTSIAQPAWGGPNTFQIGTPQSGNSAGWLLSGYILSPPTTGVTAWSNWTTSSVWSEVIVTFEAPFWAPVYYQQDSAVLANATTGWLNTWEPLIDGMTLENPTAGALTEMKGIYDPVVQDFTTNGLFVLNNSGSTSNIELRSISRTPADITNTQTYPNTGQVIGDGLPVPYTIPPQAWNASVQYPTGIIVTYQGMPFLSLKSSKGIAPPSNGIASNEWQPIGLDNRVGLMLSGYTSQPFNYTAAENFACQPYVLWFDETGTFISSLYVRTNLSGNAPANITFDSFSLPSAWGSNLASTAPDIGAFTWTQAAGTFQVNAFSNGSVVPSTTGQTLAVMNYGSASAFVGVTLSTLPNGQWEGLVLRYSSVTSYIRVDQKNIISVNGTALTILATHTTPFQSLDRMTASCNGNVITVYRNGIQVSTVTTSFNNTQTSFGIVVDNSAAIIFGHNPKPHFTRVYQRSSRQRSRVYAQGIDHVYRSFA